MKRVANCRNALKFIFVLCSLFNTWTTACNFNSDCSGFFNDEKCCHGTCIDDDATCISGGAIAGIVIGCLIIGGTIISCCLCFCCACGPFQNRSQGTVIRYGGAGAQTQTTTTGTSYPSNVQAGYGTSYPQPAPVNYPNTVQSQGKYPQPGPAPYPNAVQGQAPYAGPLAGGAVYPPPSSAPPSYDEASVPPPYNPVYPS